MTDVPALVIFCIDMTSKISDTFLMIRVSNLVIFLMTVVPNLAIFLMTHVPNLMIFLITGVPMIL